MVATQDPRVFKKCLSTEWQYQLAVERSHDRQGACVGVPDFAPHLRGELQNQNIAIHEGLLAEDASAVADGANCGQIWSTMTRAAYDDCTVEKSILMGYGVGPLQCPEMDAQSWVPQQRNSDTPMARWAGEMKDWIQLVTQTRPRKEDVIRNLL